MQKADAFLLDSQKASAIVKEKLLSYQPFGCHNQILPISLEDFSDFSSHIRTVSLKFMSHIISLIAFLSIFIYNVIDAFTLREGGCQMKKTLVNIMEHLVLSKIDEMADSLDCCTCEYCKADIAAIVLNQIPSKYVVTEKGALYSKLEQYNLTDMVGLCTKIALAAEIVREHPRHLD